MENINDQNYEEITNIQAGINQIPILFVHGLFSSVSTFSTMINDFHNKPSGETQLTDIIVCPGTMFNIQLKGFPPKVVSPLPQVYADYIHFKLQGDKWSVSLVLNNKRFFSPNVDITNVFSSIDYTVQYNQDKLCLINPINIGNQLILSESDIEYYTTIAERVLVEYKAYSNSGRENVKYPLVLCGFLDNHQSFLLQKNALGSRMASVIKYEYGANELYAIGHSMGGVVLTKLMQESPETIYGISKLVAIDSPINGSSIDFQKDFVKSYTDILWKLPIPIYSNLRADALEDLAPTSDAYKTLKELHYQFPRNTLVLAIAAIGSEVVPIESANAFEKFIATENYTFKPIKPNAHNDNISDLKLTQDTLVGGTDSIKIKIGLLNKVINQLGRNHISIHSTQETIDEVYNFLIAP